MSVHAIALYGREGVGTSTTAANISAALAEAGFRVLQVGVGPGYDSTGMLRGGKKAQTLFDALRHGASGLVERTVVSGFKGVLSLEAGLPVSDAGSSGHSLGHLLEILQGGHFLAEVSPDIVIYDISGEAVYGAIVDTLLGGLVEGVYAVSSADSVSIFAVNGFFRLYGRHAAAGTRFGGIVGNGLTAPFAEELMADFAGKTGTGIIGSVPRSLVVLQSALYGQTVIEASPLSHHAYYYRRLARHMVENDSFFRPNPLAPEEMEHWTRGWGDMIRELDSGIVGEGAGI